MFPGVSVDAHSFHVSLTDVLVAKLLATFSPLASRQFTIEDVLRTAHMTQPTTIPIIFVIWKWPELFYLYLREVLRIGIFNIMLLSEWLLFLGGGGEEGSISDFYGFQ